MTDPISGEFWAFDCPWHGLETEAFCFRAFSEEEAWRWKKMRYEEIETTESERTRHFLEFQATAESNRAVLGES